jgi:chromatin remodeling complex protein RSC6
MTRTEVTRKVWEYTNGNDLQDAANKRNFNADVSLKLMVGKDRARMFEMTRLLTAHLR